MIRLVASDIDGTLFDENAQPTPDIFDLIRELNYHKIRFCVSSGRRWYGLKRIFEPVLSQMDVVASNGAEVYVAGMQIGREVFSHDAIMLLEHVVNRFEYWHLTVADENINYVCDTSHEKFRRLVAGPLSDIADNLCNAIPGPDANLLSCWVNCERPEDVPDATYVLNLELGHLFTFSPTSVSIDVTPKHVSKATGIRKVMQHYGVTKNEAIAYGDSMNDYDIMRLVGHPRAVENASYCLKQIAERVVASNVEHGVQQDIRALLDSLEETSA